MLRQEMWERAAKARRKCVEGKGKVEGRVERMEDSNGRGKGEVAAGVYVTQATLVRASTATRVTRQRRMKEAA